MSRTVNKAEIFTVQGKEKIIKKDMWELHGNKTVQLYIQQGCHIPVSSKFPNKSVFCPENLL